VNTLQKRLSEIRDLRAEELDLVGGAGEGENPFPPPYGTMNSSWANMHYMTSSMIQITPGNWSSQSDDGTTQYVQVDTYWD
jgi:hypothetical protein